MLAWYLTVYDVQSSKSLVADQVRAPLISRIAHGLASVPRMFDEGFGDFGWLDTPMPRLALYLLVGLIAAGMSLGLRGAGSRLLLAIVMVLGIIAGMVVFIDVNYYSLFRLFGVQGRHIAPLMVGAILLATSRLVRNRTHERVFALAWAVIVGWSAWGALRRYSVGIRPDNVFDMVIDPQWQPLLGLWPSLILLMAAPVLVAMVVTSHSGEAR